MVVEKQLRLKPRAIIRVSKCSVQSQSFETHQPKKKKQTSILYRTERDVLDVTSHGVLYEGYFVRIS